MKQKLKKIFLFVLGLYVVPELLSAILTTILKIENHRFFVGYLAIIYLLVYFISPFLYQGKIREKIPNRYLFYTLLYLPFATLFILIYL